MSIGAGNPLPDRGIRAYLAQLAGLFRSKLARDTGKVFLGNLGGQGINFLAILLLIRNLEPAQFGLFSTALALMMLASQFSDLGISTGFVRYASVYLKESPPTAEKLFKITLLFKAGIGSLVLALGLLISPWLARGVFHSPELVNLFRVAFLGSLGLTMWGFLQAVLQAREWFAKYAWINVFNNSLKLLGVAALLLWHRLSADRALWILAVVPFVGFLLDGILIPRGFVQTRIWNQQGKAIFSELFRFSKWVTLSTLCTMVLLRLEVFMLQSLAGSQAVGIFNSANQLAMIFPILTNSLTISLLPKVSSYRTRDEILSYIRKVLKVAPAVILVFACGILVSGPIVTALFGSKYLDSIPIFKVLLLAFSVSVILNPMSLILYSLERPSFFFLINLLQLMLAIPMNLGLIPRFGGFGASFTVLAIRLLALFMVAAWIIRYVRSGGSRHDRKAENMA